MDAVRCMGGPGRNERFSLAVFSVPKIKKLPDSEIDPALHHAANAVMDWPKFDLFPQHLRG